jgi:hypothetical protein
MQFELSATLECGGLAPLCYRLRMIGPKRRQAAALQGGPPNSDGKIWDGWTATQIGRSVNHPAGSAFIC